jgi:hypothetical protein
MDQRSAVDGERATNYMSSAWKLSTDVADHNGWFAEDVPLFGAGPTDVDFAHVRCELAAEARALIVQVRPAKVKRNQEMELYWQPLLLMSLPEETC